MNKHDLTFMKHFAQLIVGLVVLAIFLILAAMYIYGQQPREENPALVAAVDARIATVGAVFSGETRTDASAVTAYFKPLDAWLTQQNKGQQCGW